MTLKHILIMPALVVALAACAAGPSRPDGASPDAGSASDGAADTAGEPRNGQDVASEEVAPGPAGEPEKPERPVPPEVMYNVFAGEVAGHHEDYSAAARYYLNAALASEDPELAERATQIALYAGDNELAREAVARLIEIAPESRRAHRTGVALAVEEGNAALARDHLSRVIEMSETAGAGWREAAQLLARSGDAGFALGVMGDMVAEAGDVAAAWRARSQLASHFDRLDDAIAYAGRAIELAPENPDLKAWRGRLRLSDADYAGAAADLEEALGADPDNREAALNLAEALRRDGQYARAQAVLADLDQNPELVKTRAALALEDEDWELARQLYEQLLENPEYRDESHYFLGQLAELQEQYEEALDRYSRVKEEQFRLDARIRQAVVLAEMDRVDDAMEVLAGLKSGDRAAAEEAFLAQGQILSDAGRTDAAFDAYEEGLNRLPESGRLLYARALLAAESGRLERAEADFRAIIEENPEDPLALNALGYTLADQTDRLQEARDLVARAYELAPDDAAIVDSMGWVQYRLGNHDEALEYLRRALDLQFDAEIAAHLGEVLWVTGEHEQAREVWEEALERMPDDSEVVRRTMERLTP